MTKQHLLLACSSILLALAACASESTTPRGFGAATDPADGGQEEAGEPSTPADAGKTPAKDAGKEPVEEEDPTADLPLNDKGCLTYAAAQQVCGSASGGDVCEFALECDATTNAGECSINCEMQSTITCFSRADAKCLLDAMAAKSCSALAACKWKL